VAKFAQQEVMQKIPKHMAPKEVEVGEGIVDVARQVWDATVKEVSKGWLDGPLSARGPSKPPVGGSV